MVVTSIHTVQHRHKIGNARPLHNTPLCHVVTQLTAPSLARAHYFYARVLRSDGNYDGAAAELRKVLAQYPRDRVAINDLGRIQFLQRKYRDAITTLNGVLAIDPEDLQAQYNLMLCYGGLGDEKQAKEHQQRYLRFKADESAQTITG